jgi:hypothetical protein
VEVEKKKVEAAKRKVAEKRKQEQEEKAVREVEETAKRMKRKRMEESEDEDEDEEEEEEDKNEKHFLVLDPPCKRCKEHQEWCMKEVGGKGTSCVQWADKGKGKEVKKRVVKKARSEFEVGPS